MIHLLGLYDSPYVRRVAIALTCYEMPFTHESLSVFRHVDAMRPKNPLLRVPQLTAADGSLYYESALILDYLDEQVRARGGEALVPAAGAERHAVWQTMAIAQMAADKAVAIAYEFRRPQALRWDEWLARLRDQLRAAFALLEARLAQTGGDWLVGQRMSHADVMAVVAVSFIRYVLPDEWPGGEWPGIEALAARLEATPAFLAVPIDAV